MKKEILQLIQRRTGSNKILYSLKEQGILPDSCTSNDDVLQPFKNGEAAMAVLASSNALTSWR